MKTVALTISRGSIAYNLLHNDFYRELRERYHLIIFTSAHSDKRFLDEFSHPNVSFVPLEEVELSFFEEVIFFFHKHLIYNPTVAQKDRWGIIGDPKSKHPTWMGYKIRKIVFGALSKIHFLRDIVRYIDSLFLQRTQVQKFKTDLRSAKVDLVVATFINSNVEAALIKASNELGIPSIGYPKSWDNLSKHGLRAKPGRLIVWNESMRRQAISFDNYKKTEVDIVGVPQYDAYVDQSLIMSREQFCKEYDLDPKKKIILFGSEGKLFPSDSAIAKLIFHMIENKELGYDAQLLVRPHYGYKADEKKFADIAGEVVKIDMFNKPSSCFRDSWDHSPVFAKRFINCLYHADVLINTASTLTIDAVCFDTPVINIAFNGEESLPYKYSVARWYETYYYKEVLQYNATVLVKTRDELRVAISTYFENPSFKQQERMKLKEDFCFKFDGHSGYRLFESVQKSI